MALKTITIGDLHGLDHWKKIHPGEHDLIIFLGDYVDSFTVPNSLILYNLTEILEFKDKYPEKVVLLMGNHENSYLSPEYRCSGYRGAIAAEVKKLLREHAAMFKAAYQHGNHLWTHAGVEQEYFEKQIKPYADPDHPKEIAPVINRLYQSLHPDLFEVGPERGGPRNAVGGPFWVHATVLAANPLRGFHQVVGHTPVPRVITYRHRTDRRTSVTFCDCIERGDGGFYRKVIR